MSRELGNWLFQRHGVSPTAFLPTRPLTDTVFHRHGLSTAGPFTDTAFQRPTRTPPKKKEKRNGDLHFHC